MDELKQYCRQELNTADVRQARIFMDYIIATLLGGDTRDVRFYAPNGDCFRTASFQGGKK